MMPPAAFVASTQSWKTALASAVDPDATPVKVPMAPTTNGVPLALVLGLAEPVATALPDAELAGVVAGAVLVVDDKEEEQAAAVSAARASAASAPPVDLTRLGADRLRVIIASVSAPGCRTGPGAVDLMFRYCGSAGHPAKKLND